MGKSVLEDVAKDLFYVVRLKLEFRDKMLAGIPRNESMLDYFMNAKHMSDAEKADFQKRVETGALSDEEREALKETAWCCFEPDLDGYLTIWHGNLKAMLREVFVTLGLTQKAPKKRSAAKETEGAAGGRQTLQHAVHVDGYLDPTAAKDHPNFRSVRVLIEKHGKPIRVVDGQYQMAETDKVDANGKKIVEIGFMDKVKHIQDASGKRSALGRHDFVDRPELNITIKWPVGSVFDMDDMKKAFALAQENGLGACRSQGYGKFDCTAWEVLNAPVAKKKAKEEDTTKDGAVAD